MTLLLIVVLGLSVVFDYINGFHDTANAIATSVSTRALKPEYAILMSATANFLGALTGTAVAIDDRVGTRHDAGGTQGQVIVAAALVGAIAWNLLTWRLGIPSSSSHALIGGLLGAVDRRRGRRRGHLVRASSTRSLIPLIAVAGAGSCDRVPVHGRRPEPVPAGPPASDE